MTELLLIKHRKPVKVGNSFYFTIPKQYINNGVIDKKKEYTVIIKNARAT